MTRRTSLGVRGRKGGRVALGLRTYRPASPPSADIAPPGGAPVRPFYIDPRTHSPAAVADRLWAAVAEATGTAAAPAAGGGAPA
jgi:hypothetical protein